MACLWLTNKLIHLLKTTFCNKLQGRWRRQIVKDKADPGTLWEKFQTTSIIRSPSKHFYSTSTLKSSVNSSEIIGPRISKVIISKRQAKPLGSRGPGSRWDIYRRRLTWCSETHRRHSFNLQLRILMIIQRRKWQSIIFKSSKCKLINNFKTSTIFTCGFSSNSMSRCTTAIKKLTY